MSALLAGTAMRTKVGDRSAKQVLEHLCNYADENDRAWPSVSTLADECECSPSTVQRALRYLEDAGLLERDTEYGTRYGADRSPYVYHITIADAEKIIYTHQRAKTKKANRARARKKRGSTSDTPRGIATATPRGSTHDHDGVAHMTPRGVAPTHERGSTSDTQTYIEHSLRTSRESTRAKTTTIDAQTNPRRQALADLTPDPTHRALADRLGLDLDSELEKFRDRCLADGRLPADPAAALRLWLRRGRELGLGTTPGEEPGDELTRRARRLVETSTILKRRQPDRASRMRWVPAVRRLLAEGREAVDVVGLISSGDPDELAAIGLDLDDIDRIA
ncbi:helix-turn-helix domain-containing protein [Bifidobacterium samirii]|uniref:DNA-binding helix-turn-helix protein n=1 Tax=Bifidobacterium samirii TaxID=2306974 RepID=A0A430FUB5_9BIFI|nr:helix-turn-helix domain-containing protein [Bifidobacterium samirii]RSX56751.1 DNA-binding helix-turn-helix protein [Bifidobacterium samirii]